MALYRSLLFWTTLLSLLFSVASAVALPEDNDHKWARHQMKTITVTATTIQTCSTPKSFGMTSSHSSTPTSCPSIVAQIIKTVTASSTFTVTARQTTLSTVNDRRTVTVTRTDTVTSVLSGSKITGTTLAPSTVTVTRTVTAGTVTITRTVPQSGVTRIVTVTAPALTGTITVTTDLATTDLATTVTDTATTTLTTTATATCTNPVINGGFEAGTVDWTSVNNNPGATFTTEPSSSIPGGAHSGSYAGAFIFDGVFLPGIPVDISQTIASVDPSCAATGQYQISVFVKTVSNSCFINIYNNIESPSPVVSTQISGGGSDPPWEEVLAVVSMPLQSGWTLTLEAACNTQDTVWFDDIVVMAV
jgi:hypothetical protein